MLYKGTESAQLSTNTLLTQHSIYIYIADIIVSPLSNANRKSTKMIASQKAKQSRQTVAMYGTLTP